MSDERAKLSRQLLRHGARRRESLHAADEAMAQIAHLLPTAPLPL
jgi:hypothetical protein